MTDIEKVARAIYEADDPWHKVWPWPDLQSDQAGVDQYRRIAQAAIVAMHPVPQWQGIESAPRNGTCVLLWIPADDGLDAYIASGWYESGVFDNRWYAAMDENPLSPQPTHWMPLPTPPAGGSDAER